MKLTERDRVLMLVIPGLAILMIYVLIHFTTGHRELTKLQTELARSKERQPTDAQLLMAMQKASEADAKLEAAKKGQRALQAKWAELAEPWLAQGNQHERLTRLLALLKRNELHLVNHVPASQAKESAKLRAPASAEKLAKQIAERGNKQPPQLWRMQIIGTYANVLHSLEELSSGEHLAIPVALSMKQPENLNSAREWFILVWI